MPEMISLRKFTLSTKSGHMVFFNPNTPSHVPDEVVSDAMAAGCVMADGSQPFFDENERPRAEFQGTLRKSLIHLALRDIVKGNKSADFDASGLPKPEAVKRALGFEVFQEECNETFRALMRARKEKEPVELHKDANTVFSIIGAESKEDLLAHAIDDEQAKGLTMKDLRKHLLHKFSGLSPS